MPRLPTPSSLLLAAALLLALGGGLGKPTPGLAQEASEAETGEAAQREADERPPVDEGAAGEVDDPHG